MKNQWHSILGNRRLFGVFKLLAASFCGVYLAATAQAQAPVITAPPQSQSAKIGDNVTFTVSASGTLPLSYAWLYTGVSTSTPPSPPRSDNFTQPTLVILGVQPTDAGGYRVTVTDPNGSTARAQANLTVYGITQQPQSQSVYPGTRLTLSVGAAPDSGHIHWFKDSVSIGSGTPISPSLNQLLFNSIVPSQAGNYWAEIDTPFGPIQSAVATIAVRGNPSFAGGNGSESDPFQIATAQQLDAMRTRMDKNYVLTSDLDLAGTILYPLGDDGAPYAGHFDGAGHVIRNWTVNEHPLSDDSSTGPYLKTGLFRVLGPTAIVNDLALVNCAVSGQHIAGTLAGENQGRIVNCSSSGSVIGRAAGGLVGLNDGEIVESDSQSTVKADFSPIIANVGNRASGGSGGLAGINLGTIRDSHATGNVESNSWFGTGGGLVGFNSGLLLRCHATGAVSGSNGLGGLAGASPGTIDQCFASGDLVGDGLELGGLVGRGSIGSKGTGSFTSAAGSISNSFASGTVASDGGRTVNYMGGLAGRAVGAISNSYAVGFLQFSGAATATIGGLLGGSESPFQDISNYWDIDTTGLGQSMAGSGKISAELQDQTTFVGWDFANTWTIVSGSFPALRSSLTGFPVVIDPPPSVAVPIGSPANFTVVVDGNAPLSYQWQLDGSDIPGATGSVLMLANSQLSDQGAYTVVVTNSVGSVVSDAGTLQVLEDASPPEIANPPLSQTANDGDAVVFSVDTVFNPLATYYQWFLNGSPVAGETASTLTLSSVSAPQAGAYTVTVSNQAGSVTSDPAVLSVVLPMIDSISPDTVNTGADLALTVFGSGFGGDAVVNGNGSRLVSSSGGPTQLFATIPAANLGTGMDISTLIVTVVSSAGSVSNPKALTILPADPSNVSQSQSDAASVAQSTTVATSSDDVVPGVTAILQNNGAGSGAAAITVASYVDNPTPAAGFALGGGYVDVQATGVDSTDVVTTSFYYPSSIAGTDEDTMLLQYFDGAAWQPVLSSGGASPVKDTTDNLDATISGGRFSVIFDATSTPAITALTGTVFTVGPASHGKKGHKHKPKILVQPKDQKVVAGRTATFEVKVKSGLPVAYQWFGDGKHGCPIHGATGATLILQNVTPGDAGTYVVKVTNQNGTTTSRKAELTVEKKKK